MVWSQHDFERELKRQLVEIESIRKRVSQAEEIMERLDRLEESHLCLIRKLGEYFARTDGPGASSTGEASSCGGSTESGAASEMSGELSGSLEGPGNLEGAPTVDEGLLAEFHVLSNQHSDLARRCVLEGPPSAAEDGSQEESAPQVVLVAEAVLNVPDLNERCATCGKVLISGLLAGEGITQRGSDWHHQACIETGDQGDRHSSILN